MKGRSGGMQYNKLSTSTVAIDYGSNGHLAVNPRRPRYLRYVKQRRVKGNLTLEAEFIRRQKSQKVR